MRTWIAVVAAVVFVGCGGHSPAAPTPTPINPVAPVVSGVTLTGVPEWARIGVDVTVTGQAKRTDGSTTNIATLGTWTTDNPAVATVAGGVVHPLTLGTSMLSVTYEQITARALLHVTQNFQGAWGGSWSALQCTTGVDRTFCRSGDALTLTLTQTDRSVTGTLHVVADYDPTVSGTIDDSGVLRLTGSTPSGNIFELGAWQSTVINRRMSGQFAYSIRSPLGAIHGVMAAGFSDVVPR